MEKKPWIKYNWRAYPIAQNPGWPDAHTAEHVVNELSQLPALVFAGKTRALKQQLAEVIGGKAFVLQCGDCSEDFSRCNGARIHNFVKVILQMSIILANAEEKQVVNIEKIRGRMPNIDPVKLRKFPRRKFQVTGALWLITWQRA